MACRVGRHSARRRSGVLWHRSVVQRDRPRPPGDGDGVGIMFAANPQVHACDDESVRRMPPPSPMSSVIAGGCPGPAGRHLTGSPDQRQWSISWRAADVGGRSSAGRPALRHRLRRRLVCRCSRRCRRRRAGRDLRLRRRRSPRRRPRRRDGKPVGDTLGHVAGRGGEPTRGATSSDPDGVAVLDVGDGPRRTVFIADLRPVTRVARISGWPGRSAP